MKVHSYFRNKILYGNPAFKEYAEFIPRWAKDVKVEDLNIPDIKIQDMGTEVKRFCYFFFVPTLVYRDRYARTPSIRWNKVLL